MADMIITLNCTVPADSDLAKALVAGGDAAVLNLERAALMGTVTFSGSATHFSAIVNATIENLTPAS